MFNITFNDIKQSKKQYSSKFKNNNNDTYRLHEKISSNLNHSIQSNITEATTSKSNTAKTFLSRNPKISVNEKKNYSIQKCSYTNFLELRKPKNTVPFGNTENRFKWQNLKEENIVLYPEIYKKPHKKQYLLKETFGEDLLDFNNNKKVYDGKPKIRRLRRCFSEQNLDKINPKQNIDINISRRVIEPSYNKEQEKFSKKKSFSQSNFNRHRANGGFKSLFELTPLDIPIKGKKLFKTKSYGALNINLFDKNYGQYEMPTHTKKHFFDNKCFYDHITDQNRISDMKNKRSRSVNPGYKTDIDIFINKVTNIMKLRNYGIIKSNNNANTKNLNKIKKISKIKRNTKKNEIKK